MDQRWHQMAFFVFVKMGKALLSRALCETKQLLCVQNLILYYIKQIDSMLPFIRPVIDHRGSQNVVRTSVTHSAVTSCATFLVLPHFDVTCDLLQDRCTATWNLFVKYMKIVTGLESSSRSEVKKTAAASLHFQSVCERNSNKLQGAGSGPADSVKPTQKRTILQA